MEIKSLLELANEVDDAKYQEGLKTLKDEEKTEVEGLRTLRAERKKEEDAVAALREAKRKQEELAADAQRKADQANLTFEQKFRAEQTDKAKAKIFAQLGVEKEEEKLAIEEHFKKLDSGKTDVDNIAKDFLKAAVAANPERYLEAVNRVKDFASGAAGFNASGAMSPGGSGEGGGENKKFSREAQEFVRQSAKHGKPVTLEEAEAYLKNGDPSRHSLSWEIR